MSQKADIDAFFDRDLTETTQSKIVYCNIESEDEEESYIDDTYDASSILSLRQIMRLVQNHDE